MNSQIVSIKSALKSELIFTLLITCIPISLFLKAGFVSVSVIWFFALCLFNSKRPSVIHPILCWPILFFSLLFIRVALSGDVSAGMTIMFREIHLFLIPLGFMIVNKNVSERSFQNILFLFLIGCILYSLVCLAGALINMVGHKSLGIQIDDRNYPYYSNYLLTLPINITPAYFSMFCNFAFLIALTSQRLKSKLLKSIVASYVAFFIVLIFFKPGIVCAVLIFTVWLLRTCGNRGLWYGAAIVVILVAIPVLNDLSSAEKKFRTFMYFDYREPDSLKASIQADRLKLWALTLQTINHRPIFGHGPVTSQDALSHTYQIYEYEVAATESLNPHNQGLSVLLDVGVVGFILLMAMLIVPLILSWRANDTMGMCFILIVAVFFAVESVLVRQKGIVFFSFFYSLIFSYSTSSLKRKSSSESFIKNQAF